MFSVFAFGVSWVSVSQQSRNWREFPTKGSVRTMKGGPSHPCAACSAGFLRKTARPAVAIALPVAEDGTGAFDHVAFRGDDFEAMRARVKEAGMTFKERVVPGGALKQLFVLDPEGVLVEVNFRT